MREAQQSPPPGGRGGRRFSWLTIGEVTAVLALIIAALGFWDAHRERAAVADRQQSQSRAESAFVMVGTVGAKGREIDLRALRSGQAIQSQRLVFPKAVVDHPIDLFADQPRILVDWIAPGLGRLLDEAHAAGSGKGRLPVAVITTYVADDETLTDRSEYALGYEWHDRFLAGRRIDLRGLSLVRRDLRGDPAAAVERRWSVVAPAPPKSAGHSSGSAPT